MKRIKRFNKHVHRDATAAISESFNIIEDELKLLNKRLSYISWDEDVIDVIDEIKSDIQKLESSLDEIVEKYKNSGLV